LIPLEQDQPAPSRRLRSHAFVGVDYPVDIPSVRDQTRPEREALLRRAAAVAVVPGSAASAASGVSLDVEVTNTGAGHNLPGGFGFVRQMWLEVTVRDASGTELSSSGKLADPSHDLCDASILDDAESPVRPFVVGCKNSDPLLVNFQQMLLDRTEVARDASGNALLDARGEPRLARLPDGKEAVIQHLTGGPVSRIRPHTGRPTPTLAPGERAVFPFRFTLPSGARTAARVDVRLLFRTLPPYFLRALASEQLPQDGENLNRFVTNLEITEMATASAAVAGG
jgi:hypothetical protein